MGKKWSDILIIAACTVIVGMFFIKGIIGTGGNVVAVEASSDTPTPEAGNPSSSPSPTPRELVSATPTPSPALTQTVIATPTPMATRLEAAYSGNSVIVGKEYDKNNLIVTVVYDTGVRENVTDYTVSSDIIQQNGLNTIIIMYKDMTAAAYIYGTELVNISVSPIKMDYGLGNMPDKDDLTVMGTYSNGVVAPITDDYEIYPEKLERVGSNAVTVKYQGKEATCMVYAKKWESVLALNISYDKPQMVTNMKINRDDITVMAVYSDLSAERVTTYELEKEIYYDTGKQPLTVIYGGVKKSIDIDVIERYIVGLEAEYTGNPVIVGKKFRDEDLKVYLHYVDGELVETKDYTLHTRKIRYIGNNVVNIFYGDKFSADVVIEGIEEKDPDFDYVSHLSVYNGKYSMTIDTAIPRYLGVDCLVAEPQKNSSIKKAYRKLKLKKGKYMVFSYEFEDPNDELELPLPVRITIPEEFDMDHTFLYYTPNKKSIMGRTPRVILDDRTFECTLFKVGTYILVYSKELNEDEFEE
jgi:hypothetical protein